jgi:hypothetical protein
VHHFRRSNRRREIPFSALVRRLLISCPGDVSADDIATVQQAITRWNGIYGERFGATVIPVHWSVHAAPQFGTPPQQVLNQQIVDRCDVALAIFANRLGTPTSVAPSGTAEEIQRLHGAGKYVGILRCRRLVNPASIDLDQAQDLERYLSDVKAHALLLEYEDSATLMNQVDAFLVAAVAHDQGRTEVQLQNASQIGPSSRVAEVWPRVEVTEHLRPDGRGRMQVDRHWYLILSNTGDAPARNVQFRLTADGTQESGQWQVITETGEELPQVPVLAPRGETRFSILVVMESAVQTQCIVTWDDDRGRQENTATLRLV